MKSFTLVLGLLAATLSLRAQDVATTFSPATERHDTAGPALLLPTPSVPGTPGTPGSAYQSTSDQASANFNGVSVQVQALPASNTVLVSFSVPQQQTLGLLELANARTGQLVYSGSVLVREGQVELPVVDVSQPFEARLATDHDVVIARMAQ